MPDRTVIVGAGEIGQFLAKTLSQKRKDVILIDHDKDKLNAAEDLLDVEVLHGHGASAQTLKRAGVGGAQLAIAVTDADEVNMICAMAAKLLGAKRTVARIRNHVYLSGTRSIYRDYLGIDIVVSPEVISAMKLVEIIRTPGAIWVENFASGQVRLLSFQIQDNFPYLDIPLAKLERPVELVLVAILREGKVIIPKGHHRLQAGDHVYLVTVPKSVETIMKLFNITPRVAKKVMIFGATEVGLNACWLLERRNIKVRLLDPDFAQCEKFSSLTEKIEVVQGDATDPATLKEENVSSFDTFMAVARDDRVNLNACRIAKDLGATSCAAVVHSHDLLDHTASFGADVVISPRTLASGVIHKLILKSQVVSMAELENGKAEILEIIGTRSGKAKGLPLKDAGFPEGAVIGAILKEDKVIIPRGSDTIDEGDHAIVFVLPEVLGEVERLFGGK